MASSGSVFQGMLTAIRGDAHPALTLFVFLFSVYGLANAIAVLKIGRFLFGERQCTKEGCTAPGHPCELRRFLGRIPFVGDLFYCPPCLSFWIGMVFSKVILSPSSLVVAAWGWAMVLDGLMACGIIWLIHLIAERLKHGLPDI
jgi:hypothetical protein